MGLGGHGAEGQHVCQWVITPVHPLQGVRAAQGVISVPKVVCVLGAAAEWDPSSPCFKFSADGLQKVT